MRGRLGSAACASVLLVLSSLLAACSGSTPSSGPSPGSSSSGSPGSTATADACRDVPALVVTAVQHYVDSYGTRVSGQQRPGGTPATGDTELRNALSQTRDELARRHCDTAGYQQALRRGLAGVTARGPLARAVFLRLQASLSGTARGTAATVAAKPGQDLGTLLAELAPGSTLRLAPGDYRVDESLVLLQGVTLRGAGVGRTRITSTAPEVGVLVLTDARVELAGLTLRHRGAGAASGLIGGPTSSVVLTDVRVTGAKGGRSGRAGGAGVLMSGQNGAEAGRGTTLEVTGSSLDGNSGAGILLTGRHRVSIRHSRFARNRQCGICFTGGSSGAVRTSTFAGNAAGLAVLDTADPLVQASRISGGLVGVQVGGTATPVLRDVRISGTSRAAMIFADRSSGRVEHVDCSRVTFGIVVSGRALPYVGATSCPVARGR